MENTNCEVMDIDGWQLMFSECDECPEEVFSKDCDEGSETNVD